MFVYMRLSEFTLEVCARVIHDEISLLGLLNIWSKGERGSGTILDDGRVNDFIPRGNWQTKSEDMSIHVLGVVGRKCEKRCGTYVS